MISEEAWENRAGIDGTFTGKIGGANTSAQGVMRREKSVIGAHNKCWKFAPYPAHGPYYVPSPNWEAKRDCEFILEDKGRNLKSLWRELNIGDILPWEDVAHETEMFLAICNAHRDATQVTTIESRQMMKK